MCRKRGQQTHPVGLQYFSSSLLPLFRRVVETFPIVSRRALSSHPHPVSVRPPAAAAAPLLSSPLSLSPSRGGRHYSLPAGEIPVNAPTTCISTHIFRREQGQAACLGQKCMRILGRGVSGRHVNLSELLADKTRQGGGPVEVKWGMMLSFGLARDSDKAI